MVFLFTGGLRKRGCRHSTLLSELRCHWLRVARSRHIFTKFWTAQRHALALRFDDRDESGVSMQKGRLAGQPNESTVDRRARLAARFVAETGRQEIAAAEAAVAQARLGRGDLEAAIARLGRARSALADALAVLD
jgi:hypothetical protein